MLTIHIDKHDDFYNNKTNKFISIKETILVLEHSLVSVSKWEAKWHKPFISSEEKTNEEFIDYVKCMTITQNVDPNAYLFLSNENVKAINEYISNPMTATWFNDRRPTSKRNSGQITSELIYYWMVALQIPWEAQKWHLNRLLVLVRICNEKNRPPEKYSKKEILSKNAALNAARRKSLGTSG